MTKIVTNNNLCLVGNLQVFATPFASLYMDRMQHSLFLFVRVSAPTEKPQYLVSDVSGSDLQMYMSGECGLKSLYTNKSHQLADVENDGFTLQPYEQHIETDEMKKVDMFDQRYCLDRVKLKYFLKRYENNQLI